MDGNYFYIDGNSLDGRDLFEWTEILLVFLNAFFIIGLQRLASQLQNPFVREKRERWREGEREKEREEGGRDRERKRRETAGYGSEPGFAAPEPLRTLPPHTAMDRSLGGELRCVEELRCLVT
jgi:hypothetical protein